jgi:prophage regulatory protein
LSTTLLRLKKVLRRTGLTKTILYQKIKAGTFPASIPLTERTVAWISDDVDGWIEEHIAHVRRPQGVQNQDGLQ